MPKHTTVTKPKPRSRAKLQTNPRPEPESRQVSYTVSKPEDMDIFLMSFAMACGGFVLVSDRKIDETLFRATLTAVHVDLAITLIDYTTRSLAKRTQPPVGPNARAVGVDVVSAWNELRSAIA